MVCDDTRYDGLLLSIRFTGGTDPSVCFDRFREMQIRSGHETDAKVMLLLTDGRPNIQYLHEVLRSVERALNDGWIVYAFGS